MTITNRASARRPLQASDLPDLFDVQVGDSQNPQPSGSAPASDIALAPEVLAKAPKLPAVFNDYFIVETA